MDSQELIAYAVFVSYFLLIFLSFALVFRSILSDVNVSQLFSGKPFFFLRTALGALFCTWYFMFQFMNWSYTSYTSLHRGSTFGTWLVNTPLFEQAWTIVCTGPIAWWWSSWICTWTVVFTAIVWAESARRGLKYPYAYMLLGQLVAMSVATGLFLVALALHPRKRAEPRAAPPTIWAPLVLAFVPIYLLPQRVGTNRFMSALLWLHGTLLLPLTTPTPKSGQRLSIGSIPYSALYAILTALASGIHALSTKTLLASIPKGQAVTPRLYHYIFSHPAQASISFDVIWVAMTLVPWWISTGPFAYRIVKALVTLVAGGAFVASHVGVNWALLGSVIPILVLLGFGTGKIALQRIRAKNIEKRAKLLASLGRTENTLIQGTANKAPYISGNQVIVGFWHPYCNSGGGGERVLWTAIRHLQKTEKDVVVLVYSGDYPSASKEAILEKVKNRFSVILDPATLQFVPLPSRHLISDTYWQRFTLLGQSLGSLYLAWEGLCSKDGMWGDIFIDSMGYAFTFPLVRLIAGSNIAVGAYVHYPTVSADMVKRVRERSEGVENAGASKSWMRTKVKLVYYHIFTSLYSVSLLFSEHIMTNSSWTQAHIFSLLAAGRSSFIAGLLLKDETSLAKREERGESKFEDRAKCEVVYPPCDTKEMVKLGGLEKRKRELMSLAQFRPEKDHAKQIHAMKALFDRYPNYRSGPARITLALMGGCRDAADEARLEGLKQLAIELKIEENVEFVVNAPYAEVVRRLGEASIGLNTMMDEHFGINVVEFMAAGLIPIVHASAGPLLDIIVPLDGQKTGFHATDATSFAESIHSALSLSKGEQLKIRQAARKSAVQKFSEEEFERGFQLGWGKLRRLAEVRRRV